MEIGEEIDQKRRDNVVWILYNFSLRPDHKESVLRDSIDITQAIGPVERTLNLLISFQGHKDGASLTELARQVDLAPSTTARLLKILERYEFVRRGSDR